MRRKILINMCLLSLVSSILSSFLILSVSKAYLNKNMHNQIEAQAHMMASAFALIEDKRVLLENMTQKAIENRITIIAHDGSVLFDSFANISQMQNHMDRPEVQEAFAEGNSSGIRHSATQNTTTFYYAVRLEDATILRLSATVATITSIFFDKLGFIILSSLAIFLLCMIISARLTQKMLVPINQINLDNPCNSLPVYDELAPLMQKINTQSKQIRTHIEELEYRANTIAAITQNMQEGLLVLGTNSNILSVNTAAKHILSLDKASYIGENIRIVSRNMELLDAVKYALLGESHSASIQLGARRYQIFCSPVADHETIHGVILLMLDSTDREKAEKNRREFTANVSHELKTPLTSISGYAEMIHMGMALEEDIKKFGLKIHNEASRLIVLIEDIIRLSQLDEAEDLPKDTQVDLYKLAEDVLARLEDYAQKESISLTLVGESTSITGDERLLEELLYNLCDNAIKYNNAGGSVTVCVRTGAIEVMDTGVGIPQAHWERVFERFYRADKSRSKKTGGTGLGLAIAKHIAEYHGGKLYVKNSSGQGTVIEVLFSGKRDRNFTL